MAELIDAAGWASYETAINNAGDTFNKELVTWHKSNVVMQRNGEDPSTTYVDIELQCLMDFNEFKSWPDLSSFKDIGFQDRTSALMILNNKWLTDNGYTNPQGYFTMNPGRDKFTIRGIEYTPAGDTHTAQANNKPLLTYIIVFRSEVETGETYHGQ